jgi:adenosylmethionine-8-amino-7-oxononanoate aminotransferase
MGCAAALASLEVFEEEKTLELLPEKEHVFDEALAELNDRFPENVRETRRLGMIGAIDVVQANGAPWPADARMGARICTEARKHGLLTRPVLDTLVLMPPLCISVEEIRFMTNALGTAMDVIFGQSSGQSSL